VKYAAVLIPRFGKEERYWIGNEEPDNGFFEEPKNRRGLTLFVKPI
jgi:hypothetical protein